MKTLGEVLSLAAEYLQKKSVLAPRLSAEQLLAAVLKCQRMDLYMRYDQPLVETELDSFRELMKKRAAHEPVEYILGNVDFLGAQIGVNKSVLIPRPETEILLDKALKQEPLWDKKVLDLCTGSGCIAIALKKAHKEASVTASDICPEALTLAKENAKRNGVEVEFYVSDLFEALPKEKFDRVFCNPPYIAAHEMQTLDLDVKYEPEKALIAGEDGLLFYRKIAKELPGFLEKGAKVFFEIGATQGKAVMGLFSDPCWSLKKVEQDYSGKDRFFFLEFE